MSKHFLTEEEIIFHFTKKNKTFQFDDCEIIPVIDKKKYKNIITCDSLIENTHFKIKWYPPTSLAKKTFHVNLSDLISSGGKPLWCTVQIGLSNKLDKNYINIFIKEFIKECSKFNCKIIGGDTFYSEYLVISINMGGYTEKYINRKAKPNSYIYVTGNLGLSLLGYKILNNKIHIPEELKSLPIKKHIQPEARWKWAQSLYPYIDSMMDISDGLYQDLYKMAKVSNLQFEVYLENIPIHSKYKKYIKLEDALISGEEYELVFTSRKKLNFPFLKQIGIVKNQKPKKDLKFLNILYYGKEFKIKNIGYKHF